MVRVSDFGFARLVVCAALVVAVSGCGGGQNDESNGEVGYTEAMKIPDLEARAMQLVALSKSQTTRKDMSGASQSLTSASRAGEEVTEPVKRARILAEVASAQVAAGRKADAAKTAEKSAAAVAKITDTADKIDAATQTAKAYGEAGAAASGTSVLKLAIDELAKQADDDSRVRRQCEVAVAYNQLKQPNEAKKVLAQVAAAKRDKPIDQAAALVHVAKAYRRIDDKAAAGKSLEAAAAEIDKIETLATRAFRLCDVANEQAALGDPELANKTLDKARDLAEKESKPDLGAEAKSAVIRTRSNLN